MLVLSFLWHGMSLLRQHTYVFERELKSRGGGNFFSAGHKKIKLLWCQMGNMPAHGHWIQMDRTDLLHEGLCEGWHTFVSGLCILWCVVAVEDFGTEHSTLGENCSIAFPVLGLCSGTWASYPAIAEQGFGVGESRKEGLCPLSSLSTPNIQICWLTWPFCTVAELQMEKRLWYCTIPRMEGMSSCFQLHTRLDISYHTQVSSSNIIYLT